MLGATTIEALPAGHVCFGFISILPIAPKVKISTKAVGGVGCSVYPPIVLFIRRAATGAEAQPSWPICHAAQCLLMIPSTPR